MNRKLLAGLLCLAIGFAATDTRSEAGTQELTITGSFAGRESIASVEPIELRLSRPLRPEEGRLAILIGRADVTSLFTPADLSLRYDSATFPLPAGESRVLVYLVAPDDEWKLIAELLLRVATQPARSARSEPVRRRFDRLDFAPAINLGLKSQFAETHFPVASRPERPRFSDATIQGGIRTELARGGFRMESRFNLVGSSFRNDALRFAALGDGAPKVDLADHLTQIEIGGLRFNSGHSTFGAHRHLISNFASRGLTLVFPLGGRTDFSLAAMNSSNIAGWNNFFGLANRRHQLLGGVLGFEIFKRNPGGLRLEAGVADAWFQPRANFNQGAVTDAERSRGASIRLLARDATGRARLDAGVTRSQFINPQDPLLDQGASVVPARIVTRTARYLDAGLDLFKDHVFAGHGITNQGSPDAAVRRLNLTLNLRHERVDPLFRSIGASTQADLHRNQVEITGSFGELNFTAAHTRFNDNLGGIRSILRTNTRSDSFSINAPLDGLLVARRTDGIESLKPFLPRIGYTFERVRAAADFIPTGGGFDDPGAIPDQSNIVQSLVAEWRIRDLRLGYRLNHSLQDNRATGLDRAGLNNFTHNATIGWSPRATFDLDFEVNFEGADNLGQARADRTLRFSINTNWQATSRQSISAVFSTTGAGGFAEKVLTGDGRNIELDLQWNYRLTRESENRFKKFQTFYFIRYANRFAHVRNFAENIDTLTKLQTFNTGVNFIFF